MRSKDTSADTPSKKADANQTENRAEKVYPFISNDIVLVVKMVNGKETLFLRQIDPKTSQNIIESEIGEVEKSVLSEIVKKGFDQLKQEIVSDIAHKTKYSYNHPFREILETLVQLNYSCKELVVVWLLELFEHKNPKFMDFIWDIMELDNAELFRRDAEFMFNQPAIQDSWRVAESVELAKYPEFKHMFESNDDYVLKRLASNPAAALFPEYAKIFSKSIGKGVKFTDELQCRIASNPNAPRFPEYLNYFKPNYYGGNRFKIYQCIAANPGAVSLPEFKQLFTIDYSDYDLKHTSFEIRRMILTNPTARSLPEYADLIPLEYGVDLEVVLQNPDVQKYPEFQRLFTTKDCYKLVKISAVAKFPEFRQLIKSDKIYGLFDLAVNPDAAQFEEYAIFFTPKYLHFIGSLKEECKADVPLAYQIAKNPNAVRFPEFRRLFSESNICVKEALAGNPNATQFPEYEMLFDYLKIQDLPQYDPEYDDIPMKIKVLCQIAQNPNATKFRQFIQLFYHPDITIRKSLAGNPNAVQFDEFKKLFQDMDLIRAVIRNKNAIQFPQFKAFLTKPRTIHDPSKVIEYYEALGDAAQREDVADLPEFQELLKFLRFFAGNLYKPDPMVGVLADAAKHPHPNYPQKWNDFFTILGFDSKTAAEYDPDQKLFTECLRLCAVPPVMDPRWITSIFAARKKYKASQEKNPPPFPPFLDDTLNFYECLFPIIKGLWHNPKITQFEEYKLFSKIEGPPHEDDYFQKEPNVPKWIRPNTDIRYEAIRTYYNHLNEQFRKFGIPPCAENTPKVQACETIAEQITILPTIDNFKPEFAQILIETLKLMEQANLNPIPQAIATSLQQLYIPKNILKDISNNHKELVKRLNLTEDRGL